ncbi:TPA: hypothetical protein HA265_08385 [Candidatus Woesearchaeota archaeon]|nr:hypothetical protein [Candidatus Woesearchaeota archaeon]
MKSEAELKRDWEYLLQAIDWIPKVVKRLQDQFRKSKEGQEVQYFEEELKDHLDKNINFLRDFVPHVDKLVSIAEHFGDKKLAKSFAELANKVNKAKLPDLKQVETIKELLAKGEKLQPKPLHEFHDEFNSILGRLPNIPDIDVIDKVKRGKAPKISHFENFEVEVMCWKYLLLRLSAPEQDEYVKPIVGDELFGNTEYFTRVGGEKISVMLKMDINAVNAEVGKLFPNPRNDMANFGNLNAFGEILEKEGSKNIFMRLMEKRFNDRSRAELFMKEFAGGRRDPQTAKKIAALIKKMVTEVDQVEMAAKDELVTLLKEAMKKLYEDVEKLRLEYSKTVSERMKEIKEKHQKILLEAEEFKDNRRNVVMGIAGFGDSIGGFFEQSDKAIEKKSHVFASFQHLANAGEQSAKQELEAYEAAKAGKMTMEEFKLRHAQLRAYEEQYILSNLPVLLDHLKGGLKESEALKRAARKNINELSTFQNEIAVQADRLVKMERALQKHLHGMNIEIEPRA